MNDMMTPVVIFDLDGTLADIRHRLHFLDERPKNWEQFFSHIPFDTPIDHMVELLKMHQKLKYNIVFATGRPERTRSNTIAWLNAHQIYDGEPIYMRDDGDRRDDTIIKHEFLTELYDNNLAPTMVFDDRDRVVQMWRSCNIPCCQVADGRF